MRKLIVSIHVTLDGRVDDVLDWSIPGDDEDFVKRNIDLLGQSDGLILGRKSYEFFAAVWPSRSGEFPNLMNGIAKYVASTTLEDLEWQNTELIEGDVPEAVAKLKEQPGKGLIVYGSGRPDEHADEARSDRRISTLGPSRRAREEEQLLRRRRGAKGPRARRLDRDPVRGCHSHLPAAAVIRMRSDASRRRLPMSESPLGAFRTPPRSAPAVRAEQQLDKG